MKLNTRFWLKFSVLNLLIVSLLGVLMRYKIGFEFPHLDQKKVQHSHSHFAFLGWIAHTIFVLILHIMQEKHFKLKEIKYLSLIVANLICAYGMLVSFLISGYGTVSIVISSVSIIIGYIFSYNLYRDLKLFPKGDFSTNWFKAALVFNVLSSLGTFALAYMMGTKHFNQTWYLVSVYFYLHFQYNGFFIFACLGFLLYKLQDWIPAYKYQPMVFWLIFLSCIPAYFLSTLWAGLPPWLYILVVLAAFAQFFGWLQLLKHIKMALPSKREEFKRTLYLFVLVAIAYTIKLLLQLGSTIPAISKLAFGFRPIVIAYLHLILLTVITVFLLTYIYTLKLIKVNKISRLSLLIFVAGVFANELVLAVQGIASFSYTNIKYANELLFGVSLIIAFGLILLLFSQKNQRPNSESFAAAL